MTIKIKIVFSLLLSISLHLVSQNNSASFSYFEYEGTDVFFEHSINPKTQYRNPVLPGFYPDPSICRRGNDYFMINSSFSYFPGIPIFYSKNLVKWEQIGHVLDRPSQLKLDGLALSAGVFAPAIEYNSSNQTFYVINTVVGGIGNFIVKTSDPFKGWSDPIILPEVKGIDPSLFFDEDGKAYIVNSQAAAKPRWRGHTVLWLHKFDIENNKASEDRIMLVDGGPDFISEPKWLEGPHIYKVDGKYHLIAAEGGTLSGHKQLAFVSDKIDGSYKPSDINPILTQLELPNDRPCKVTNVGHADLIQTPQGDWFSVFLGCRTYDGEQFNTGRETFMLPVQWINNQPVILENGKAVPPVVGNNSLKGAPNKLTGNFKWSDNFSKPELKLEWLMLRTPRDQWWKIAKGKLEMDVLPLNLSQKVNPAFIARRQQHTNFDASTAVLFTPKSEKELAGMAYFQNEKNYFVIGKTLKGNKQMVVLQSVVNGNTSVVIEKELPSKSETKELLLNISVKASEASFSYSYKGRKSILLAEKVDVSNLSTKKAGGFVGSVVGMYATAEN